MKSKNKINWLRVVIIGLLVMNALLLYEHMWLKANLKSNEVESARDIRKVYYQYKAVSADSESLI